MPTLARKLRLSLCLALACLLAGCATWRPVSVPLRRIAEPARCATPPGTLLVLLPGSYSLPEDFQAEGFVRAVRERGLAADLLLVDAHVGYYRQRSIVDRLRADVIVPARAQGYRQIWLAGISIGALGAMLYAEERPDDVDGLLLLAPFLGTHLAAKEIRNAGGLAAWRAPERQTMRDLDVTLWRWLQAQTAATAGAMRQLPLFLGYGLQDRFVYNDETLRPALPASRVFTTEGGHDWPAWKPLWGRMLDAAPIARDASCALR